MRKYAEAHGVIRIDSRIDEVCLSADDGSIESLRLGDGTQVTADLFIDCSGFKALLIEQGLQTGYENWSKWLLCDSAVAVQSERTGDAAPYTVSLAHKAGWQWRIPLQHRQGNGYVFSSHYCTKAEAVNTLTQHIDGELLQEPRHFTFTAGRRKLAWHKNCIAVGLASGFLEPLESTSIALVETAIEKIRHAFTRPSYSQTEIDTFNDLTAQEYERVRDFIILHYKLNQRVGEPLWDQCRAMAVPDRLQKKIEAFTETGDLLRYPIEIFGPPSWLAIFNGFHTLPKCYHPGVDRLDEQYLLLSLAQMRKSIKETVERVPSHQAFLLSIDR